MDRQAKRTVLVVDDTQVNRKILSKLLESSYWVLEAENGKEALEILDRKQTEIAAVLLDIRMPVMDGYELMEQLKLRPKLEGIPILVMTQNNGEEAEIEALAHGASDFLSKPYKPQIIRHRLANLIKLRDTATLVNTIERDSLTGLYNKDAFYQKVKARLEECPTEAFDMIALDIEQFKLINDIYGAAEGDRLLRYIAQGIEQTAKPQGGICARISGDQYMVLFPRREGYPKRMVQGAAKRIENYPLDLHVVMKFGIYQIDDPALPVIAMCDRAALAIKKIKGKYGVDYAYYDDAIIRRLLLEQQITDDMSAALEKGQFEVYLQPKYDLASEKFAGAEALVRWNHPERGLMSPDDFIPLFERNGFISALDFYVWDQTCKIIAGWLREGEKYVPVSVNVSRVDIYNAKLPELLLELVQKHGLAPKHLHLEITETAYTENPQQLIEVVSKLKNMGFMIEMDDFGSGYSSLNMLSQLPIDTLKLDMKFIQNETRRDGSRNILSFIISLAKWMNLFVVAEGVETREQVSLLRNMDCNYVQGYYYAKPMPHPEFTALLRNAQVAEQTLGGSYKIDFGTVVVSEGKSDKIMMIVDDIPMNRSILAEYFSKQYTLAEADNGAVAYDYIKKNYEKIAVILLDLIMPVMDGFQLLENLKSDEVLKQIPVIITSQAGEMNEAKVLAMGASDFIVKPYNMEIAIRRVHNVMADTKVQVLEREKELLIKMRRIEQEAKTDSLTGLYHRAELEQQIEDFFATRLEEAAMFVILDIDNFKLINDTLGHTRGDQAILQVVKILKQCFREEDILCRMGGDEFGVFLKAELTEEEVHRRLAMLCKKLQFTVDELEISCSVGACLAPAYAGSYQELYQNADAALLRAKRLGKNQYQIFGGETELPSNLLFRNMDWLLDESSEGVFVSDAESYQLYYINEVGAQDVAHKSKQSCMGEKCYEALWNRTSPCPHCVPFEQLTGTYEEHEVNPEGTERSFLAKGKRIEWMGKHARIQYLQDNTEKKHAQQKVLESEATLRTAIEQTDAYYWEYDIETDCCRNGFSSIQQLGMPEYMENYPESLIESGFVHPDSIEPYRELHRKLKAGIPHIELLARSVAPNGLISWNKIRYTTIFDEHGNPVKAFGTTEDVDEYMQLRERYLCLIEQYELQTFVLNIPARELINEAGVQARLGYGGVIENVPESVIADGRLHPEDIPEFRQMYQAIYDGQKTASCVSRWKSQQRDAWITTKTVLVTIYDGSGNPIKAFGSSRILSE